MTHEPQFSPDWFSKPGDSLLSLMRRRNVTARQLAGTIDGGMEVLRGLFSGALAIDEKKAQALAAALGGTANYWLRRQANYERDLDRAVEAVVDTEGDDWLERVPSPGSKQRFRSGEDWKRKELRRRLAYFSVNSLRVWNERYGRLRSEAQFRTSPTLFSNERAVVLWLRQGELESALVATLPWNPNELRKKLDDIRKLTRVSHPARFLPKLKQLCAEAGVALVIVRAPAGCRASGACRLVAPDKVMVLLSFRFRSDDQFWFTLFHEFAHLLLHGTETFVDDEETLQDDREREANEFAGDCIIPQTRRAEFQSLRPDRNAVLRFSVSLGTAPGLIVGQMQHQRMIGYERLNTLKRRWSWSEIKSALA